MRTMIAASAALLLTLAASGVALAHAHLKSTEPAKDAVVAAAPANIRLEYSEALELPFSSIKLTGPDKTTVPTGAPTHGGGGESILDVPVTGTLTPGLYTVEWRILSKDGHKTKGSYGFTLKP